jgi:hypothetical protein
LLGIDRFESVDNFQSPELLICHRTLTTQGILEGNPGA